MRKLFYLVLISFLISNISIGQDSSIIKTKPPVLPKNIIIKYGIASFYANKFNGRRTSNGDLYNGTKLSAACNVLPLGTWVKVTNLRNDRSVIVQINDHLHPKNKRLIDMSKIAAEQLGFIGWGITRVKVEVLGSLKKSAKTLAKRKLKRSEINLNENQSIQKNTKESPKM